jgi:hypothetical protein
VAIYLAQLRGTLAAGDIWMAGFHLQSDDFIDGVATLVADNIDTVWSGSFPSASNLSSVKVSEINEASGDVVNVAEAPVTGITYNVGGSLPPQTAVCVTLRPVSGTRTGRFYLPPTPIGESTNSGKMATTFRDALATKLQTFFQTSLGAASAPARVGIYSRKFHSFVGAEALDIGDVFDSQRRRRNKILESRIRKGLL